MATMDPSIIDTAAHAAARQIPPLWPLASYVAVNPYLGQTKQTLAETGSRLAQIGGIPVAMPRQWYRRRIAAATITDDDLGAALEASPHTNKPATIAALREAAQQDRPAPSARATVADLCGRHSDLDWAGLIADRIGNWAGSYFDRGQALWAAPRGRSAWTAWKAFATHDLTPEFMGLKGFAAFVAEAPDDPTEAMARAAASLGLRDEALEIYFHQLLLSLGGWAQFARYELWTAELAEETDSTITDLLAIRLLWEEALWKQYGDGIGSEWEAVREAHAAPIAVDGEDVIDEILQEASERSAQRHLATTLADVTPKANDSRPALQAAFCIDVRSEVFRRALESVHPGIQTLGFAGFFGVFAKHRRFASDVEELRLPVLLNPSVSSVSGGAGDSEADLAQRYAARAKRAWGRFKLAAISSFAFVEAMGPVYVGKLVRDSLGLNPKPLPDDPAPIFDPGLDLDARIHAANTVLRAMSLTEGFARIVLLAGHGANVVNNPHASGLHCGACGGYSGEVNARLLARLLNDKDVRRGLVEKGITIPDDTVFLPALHDTTTDSVRLYTQDVGCDSHKSDLVDVEGWLASAGKIARGERALRLPHADGEGDIEKRSRDWSEVRPEWALAGCKAFIAAPRNRTRSGNFEGRAFLHDYDAAKDSENGYGVLELIMTAPVVVASWISLQYYGSTVAPAVFGSGNKLLHNVVGGVGVFEGNGGLMRGGLAWQSVHDGVDHAHEPLRLSVCIEAPIDAMTDILERHPEVRALFDNRWLHLFAMDDTGRLAHRYVGDLAWQDIDPLPQAA